MVTGVRPTNAAAPAHRRRLWVVVVVLAIVASGVLAAIFVPVNRASRQIQVDSAAGAVATLSLPANVWVTVQFEHRGGPTMGYWMNGPGGGMMFRHGGMMGGDGYSFWSSGGPYQCWAGYWGNWSGSTYVWVNATWGLL